MIAQLLKADIDAYAKRMHRSALLRRAQNGDVPARTVLAYLSSVLHLIRYTPLHLERARVRAVALGDSTLAAYFETKAHAEQGHDRWALDDIAHISRTFRIPVPDAPMPSVVRLVHRLEAAIEKDPARYLAYILFAEYFQLLLGPEWLAALERNCGIPGSAMTVVANHIELDRKHVEDGLAEIDELVRDAARFPDLRETLRHSMAHFADFCDELAEMAA
jgi:hypothetical protein